MNLRKEISFLATVICLVSPVAVFAVDEAPSFSSPAQVERAKNLAGASVSEEDAESLINVTEVENIADTSAEEYVVDLANQYADGVVKDEENVGKYEEAALLYAAESYADAKCEDKCTEQEKEDYKQEFLGLEDTSDERIQLYTAELIKINEEERKAAYNYAYQRATGDGYKNAKQTAYERYYAEEYEKALAEQIALATDTQLAIIKQERLKGKGWGVIIRELGLEAKMAGLGHFKKMGVSEPDAKIQAQDLEVLSLDAEIDQVTKRNRYEYEFQNRNQLTTKQKGKAKKSIGLTQTSVAAGSVISETVGGKEKSSNGKSESSVGSGNSNKSSQAQSGLSTSSSRSGKDKSNTGSSGARSSDKSGKSGESGDNGKGSKNDGNNGNNGNNGKGGDNNNGKGKK